MSLLPLIVEADELQAVLGQDGLRVVDLSKPDTYTQAHIHGAAHLDYPQIIRASKPTMGLLPDENELARVLGGVGITPDTHVVAYDDEGGGKAARLLWTLEVAGHRNFSLLNGGLHSWANEGHPLDREPSHPAHTHYPVSYGEAGLATREYILAHLDDANVRLLDARSPAEYSGSKVFAARGGHIPGAVNLEWTAAMDTQHNLRLKPAQQLHAMLSRLDIHPDKEVIVYCQTHHRSAFSYIMLRSLGYSRVRGYAGSWSDWGNRQDTPVEL